MTEMTDEMKTAIADAVKEATAGLKSKNTDKDRSGDRRYQRHFID